MSLHIQSTVPEDGSSSHNGPGMGPTEAVKYILSALIPDTHKYTKTQPSQDLQPGRTYELKPLKKDLKQEEVMKSPGVSHKESIPQHVSAESPVFEEVEFPPRAPPLCLDLEDGRSSRQEPLNKEQFESFFDRDGRLVKEHALRQAVFRGGVDPAIRKEVWRFLFGLYPFLSTSREREVLCAENYCRYKALKKRWNMLLSNDHRTNDLKQPQYLSPEGSTRSEPSDGRICSQGAALLDLPHCPDLPSPEVKQQLAFIDLQAQVYAGRQEVNVPKLVSAIRTIDKDVPRTDRDWQYFKGVDNPHLALLRNILVTFAAFHPKVSYAQGMNDLLSRILVVLDNEVEAYWCFSCHMERIQDEFLEDGLLHKLVVVRELLVEIDPDLCHYLDLLGVGDMTFCHRWMLLAFKREFEEEDSLRCFEILSSHHLELSSMEAEKIRDKERRKDFASQGGKNRVEEVPLNPDFTFDVFVCVTILIENRGKIFRCLDTSDVFQLTCSLTNNMDLNNLLAKSEILFAKYCCKSVIECFQVVELPSPEGVPGGDNARLRKGSVGPNDGRKPTDRKTSRHSSGVPAHRERATSAL